MTTKQRVQLAREIADFLFTCVTGERGDRLRIVRSDGTYISGWCESAVRDVILAHLNRAEKGRKK